MLIATDQPCDVASTLECGQAFRWRRCGSAEDGGHAWYEGVIFGNVVGLRQHPDGIEFRCGPGVSARFYRDRSPPAEGLSALQRGGDIAWLVGGDEHRLRLNPAFDVRTKVVKST